jgi:septal ring factor EnvC (AmiA/AmiB activator)
MTPSLSSLPPSSPLQRTKYLESTISSLKEEIKNLKQQHNELSAPANSVDPEEEAKDKQKLDLIMKRDQEMTAYIDRFEEVHLPPLLLCLPVCLSH